MRRRIFLAIGLPEDVREKVIEAVKRWQWLPIRWLSPANWHITVIPPFYADDEELAKAKEAVGAVAGNFKSFRIKFNSIMLAPPGRKARMIWLSGPESKTLQKLKKEIEKRIMHDNLIRSYQPEKRPIAAHITLARFEEGVLGQLEAKTKILEELKLDFAVNALCVVESHLKPTGAEYETLSRLPLVSALGDAPPYEFLPHTADVRMVARGRTLQKLFEHSLLGMAEYMKKGSSALETKTARPVEVSAVDEISLLIDFLSSALTLADINNEVYPEVNFDELSETHLRGAFLGSSVEEFDEDIKAVTYHGAEIKKIDGGFEATVIFDI